MFASSLPFGRVAVLCAGLLAACSQQAGPVPEVTRSTGTALITDPDERPADAKPGSCYGKDVTPATIEVVTEDKLLEPAKLAPDGAVIKPAVYETTKVQKIVAQREEFFFEVPCPPLLDEDFVATLQRALKARGFYRGLINGRMTDATRRAIRAYQVPRGLNTDILTLQSALDLGLVAYGRDGLG